MKIAFVSEGIYEYAKGVSDAVGGTERDQWLFSQALVRRGWDAVVGVARTLKPGRRESIDGVDYVGLSEAPQILLAWRRFFLEERPDWLFWEGASHLLGPVTQLAAMTGTRTVFHAAFDTDVSPRRALFHRRHWWPLYAWGLCKVDKIFVQHVGQLNALRSGLRNKATVLHKVCNMEDGLGEFVNILPHADRKRIVAWVAMLRQPKRPDVLVQIARAAPEIHFVVCGGPSSHRTPHGYGEQMVAVLKSLPNVDYRGKVSSREAAQVIADASVLLSTSDQEGFPNTFTQAWTYGTPIVSVNLDPDGVIQNKRLGALSGSVEKAITDLGTLLDSPEEREDISSRARRYVNDVHSEAAVMSIFERALR